MNICVGGKQRRRGRNTSRKSESRLTLYTNTILLTNLLIVFVEIYMIKRQLRCGITSRHRHKEEEAKIILLYVPTMYPYIVCISCL